VGRTPPTPTPRAGFGVVFVVAGGRDIGFGHVRRCLSLAEHLEADGGHVRFVTTSEEVGAFLSGSAVAVEVVPPPEKLLRVTRLLRKPAAWVVDDPHASAELLRALRRDAPLFCIDDTGDRPLPADVVVNGSAGAEGLPYDRAGGTRYLLGPKYILLRKSFATGPARQPLSRVARRLIVLTGGGEAGASSRRILPLIAETLPAAHVDLVVGPFGSPPAAEGSRDAVVVHRMPADLRALMLGADLAVTGGGQTAYELAASATPAIGVRLTENQRINLEGLARAGALVDLGAPDDHDFPQRFRTALRRVAHDPEVRRAMGTEGRRLVDGHGAARVAACLRASVRSAA
jgi:spore coat polysaccharide biosynthesis predicted glycosyltransferase SpsG